MTPFKSSIDNSLKTCQPINTMHCQFGINLKIAVEVSRGIEDAVYKQLCQGIDEIKGHNVKDDKLEQAHFQIHMYLFLEGLHICILRVQQNGQVQPTARHGKCVAWVVVYIHWAIQFKMLDTVTMIADQHLISPMQSGRSRGENILPIKVTMYVLSTAITYTNVAGLTS